MNFGKTKGLDFLLGASYTDLSLALKQFWIWLPVCSDSFHRQNVQLSAGSSCKRELYAYFFPSRLQSINSTVHQFTHLCLLPRAIFGSQNGHCNHPYWKSPALGVTHIKITRIEIIHTEFARIKVPTLNYPH
jgi:hypothetical protein